ncbi:LOW QUALITY PROTEIN: THO complex subunit 4A [Paramyrothecium foliicola]|nr:LOW QUALITY PROTEIN: THO complex subunit 4A [Paramyrothecium foliicola]
MVPSPAWSLHWTTQCRVSYGLSLPGLGRHQRSIIATSPRSICYRTSDRDSNNHLSPLPPFAEGLRSILFLSNMADKMDRGLDEIIADNFQLTGTSHQADRYSSVAMTLAIAVAAAAVAVSDKTIPETVHVRRSNPPSVNWDVPADLLRYSEWVHDRYEENIPSARVAVRSRKLINWQILEEHPLRDDAAKIRPTSLCFKALQYLIHANQVSSRESRGTKIRVENIHYDLTEEDLEELFWRIGKVSKLQLRYDRAGRSEGIAFVTYERKEDATEAVRQFDGANANGQPIRLTLMASGPSRNPFDTAVLPGKPLSERISAPGGRSRSLSPHRRYGRDDNGRKGIDRYVPDGASRSRSPMPRQRGGRRPGARREGGGGRDREGGRGEGRGNPRSKKTQEELDAEMEDYFGGNNAAGSAPAETTAAPEPAAPAASAAAPAPQGDDIDMIE